MPVYNQHGRPNTPPRGQTPRKGPASCQTTSQWVYTPWFMSQGTPPLRAHSCTPSIPASNIHGKRSSRGLLESTGPCGSSLQPSASTPVVPSSPQTPSLPWQPSRLLPWCLGTRSLSKGGSCSAAPPSAGCARSLSDGGSCSAASPKRKMRSQPL